MRTARTSPSSLAAPLATLEVFEADLRTKAPCPLMLGHVPAGFPSPADDFIDRKLDLNEHLIRNPEATFFVRAHGESMLGAGINSGDLMIVDRSAQVSQGDIVVAAVNGELTVKRLGRTEHGPALLPEHPDFTPIQIDEETDFELWGKVTYVVHKT